MIMSPGETLLRDTLEPLKITPADLAIASGLSRELIDSILSGKSPISAQTAIRLEAVIGETAESLMALQTAYDIALARETFDVSREGLVRIDYAPRAALLKEKLQLIFDGHVQKKTTFDMLTAHQFSFQGDIGWVFIVMLEVDPARSVFNPPLLRNERGLHGLPMLNNRFFFCTDEDGFSIEHLPIDFPEEFARVARLNMGDSPLNSSLRIAYDRDEKRYCFIQLMNVNPRAVPVDEDMVAFSKKWGANVGAFAMPQRYGEPAKVLLTAFTHEPSLKPLDDLAWEQIGLRGHWASGLGSDPSV
jgi:addiction module HigA family antidote